MEKQIEDMVYAAAEKHGANMTLTFSEQIESFVAAVDWSEEWLLVLLACHVVLFLLAVLTRHIYQFQAFLLGFICKKHTHTLIATPVPAKI